jgi:transcriptional regulator with XRE-family HTH domain
MDDVGKLRQEIAPVKVDFSVIKKAHKDSRLTLEEVGGVVGAGKNSVSYYLNGRRRPDPDVFIRLLLLFNLDINQVVVRQSADGRAPEPS